VTPWPAVCCENSVVVDEIRGSAADHPAPAHGRVPGEREAEEEGERR
jgi:hypothetical protein